MIKKALVSAWISVLAGAALFGVSAAFGAELPSNVPPAGLVGPTFSGLNVQGDTSFVGKSFAFDYDILDSPIGFFLDGNGFHARGPFTVISGVQGINLNGPTTIRDGNLSMYGNIEFFEAPSAIVNLSKIENNKTGTSQEGVTIKSGLGELDVNNPADGIGYVKMLSRKAIDPTKTNSVTVGQSGVGISSSEGDVLVSASSVGFIVGGAIISIADSTALTTFDDTGAIVAAAYIDAAESAPRGPHAILLQARTSSIVPWNEVIISGNGIDLVGNTSVKGALSVTNGTLGVTGNLSVSEGSISNGAISKPLLIADDVVVTGSITASGGIGTFKNVFSSWVACNANSPCDAQVSCSPGTQVTGCGYSLFYSTKSNHIVYRVYPSGSTCYAKSNNGESVKTYLQAYATCFNPGG